MSINEIIIDVANVIPVTAQQFNSFSTGSGGGTVTSITAESPLTGGTITTTGSIGLNTSGVSSGSYTNTNLTVDEYGRITSASNGSGSTLTVDGTVNEIVVNTVDNVAQVSLTDSVYITTALFSPAVTIENVLTLNGLTYPTSGMAGQVLTYPESGDQLIFANSSSSGVTSITAESPLTGGTITTTGSIGLNTSGVESGFYTSANITVDEYGRVTEASNGVILSVIGTNNEIVVDTTGNTAQVSLAITGVTSGSYTLTSLTVDDFGRITSASNGSGSSLTVDGTENEINVNTVDNIATVSLSLTNVTAGSYTNTNLTVDEFGRITSAINGPAGIQSLYAGSGISLSANPITTTGTISLATSSYSITPAWTAGSWSFFQDPDNFIIFKAVGPLKTCTIYNNGAFGITSGSGSTPNTYTCALSLPTGLQTTYSVPAFSFSSIGSEFNDEIVLTNNITFIFQLSNSALTVSAYEQSGGNGTLNPFSMNSSHYYSFVFANFGTLSFSYY